MIIINKKFHKIWDQSIFQKINKFNKKRDNLYRLFSTNNQIVFLYSDIYLMKVNGML
jgi:hypothetical protein